jgi:hypothetical protein
VESELSLGSDTLTFAHCTSRVTTVYTALVGKLSTADSVNDVADDIGQHALVLCKQLDLVLGKSTC